jgi:MarR family transcriptional regulator, transcriptional regulator for hemolysin
MLRCQIISDRTIKGRPEPLGRKLVFTGKAMREAFEETVSAAGGSLGTWIVLSALSDEGVVNQTVLASHVHVEGATITHHVDRLEELGLVRRILDPTDRRVRKIELTPAGARLHARLLAAVKTLEAEATSGIDKPEREAFRGTLEKIAANLAARSGPSVT